MVGQGGDGLTGQSTSERRQSVAPSRAIDLALAKNRYGDLGIIPLQFRPDIGEMREEGR